MNIVVTGAGIVSAIGNNQREVLDSLQKEKTGIAAMRYLPSEHTELPVGEVKLSNEEMKTLLGIDADTIVSRTSLLGAMAVKEAMADAGITPDCDARIAFINGTTVGGMDITEKYFSQMKESDEYLPLLQKHDCGSASHEIAKICGLKAEVCTVSTACSSALNAIIVGAEMLRNDEADIIIAGGTEALSVFHLNGFNTLMILDHEQCRPFDATRAGLNLGEGAAYVVLVKDSAKYPKKRAFISGYTNACDAFHHTASSENGEGAYLAMTGAISMAGLKPSDIDYVNAHGTGTPNNDASESEALKRVFGAALPFVSSTKSFTGHTTSASGSIETVISILALENEFVPANLGYGHSMENGVCPVTTNTSARLNHVLCNSFGFGGNDSSIVISKSPANELSAYNDNTEIIEVASYVIDSPDQLTGLKEFVSPLESRRMGKLLKAATLTSLQTLKAADITMPDAIITATANGMLENSENFLEDICQNGESLLKPTLFIQSTHNTISSSIAIRLKCHGYNTTYTQGEDSLAWAVRDAKRLIQSGQANHVLVGIHDESTPLFDSFRTRSGASPLNTVFSKSILFCKK